MVPYWPAYSGTIGIKGLLKTQSLVWFGLAIVLEVAALSYSERINELADVDLSYSQRQIVSALTKAGEANREAEEARAKAAEIEERAAKLETLLSWRAITREQAKRLSVAISPFSGQRIDIFWYAGDPESDQFSGQFLKVFKDDKWNVGSGPITAYDKLIVGVQEDIDDSVIPQLAGALVTRMVLTDNGRKAAVVLASALKREKLTDGKLNRMRSREEEGVTLKGVVPLSEAPIRLTIGVKPRSAAIN